MLFRSILTFCASLCHSFNYIISEHLLVFTEYPISHENLCTLIGSIVSITNIIWQITYTIPNFQILIINEINSHNGNALTIVCCYLSLLIIGTIHHITFFRLLGCIGSTSTGVAKGFQTVIVFFLSSIFYCDYKSSNCFSIFKGISLLLVVLGVVLYSYSTDHLTHLQYTATYSSQLEMSEDIDKKKGVVDQIETASTP